MDAPKRPKGSAAVVGTPIFAGARYNRLIIRVQRGFDTGGLMGKNSAKKHAKRSTVETAAKGAPEKLSKKDYERELFKLQVELVNMQTWVKETGARIVIIFEGRDAAGKGGIIKRIMERVSPRVFGLVALPAPTDREKTQLYWQRYIAQLPAAGEIVIFDRSWYNRAGVEHVMGFCSKEDYNRFLQGCPQFEATLVYNGIL